MKRLFPYPALVLAAAMGARGDVPAELSFDRYQVILDRKPFGSLPAPETLVAPQPQAESFAKRLRLSAGDQVRAVPLAAHRGVLGFARRPKPAAGKCWEW